MDECKYSVLNLRDQKVQAFLANLSATCSLRTKDKLIILGGYPLYHYSNVKALTAIQMLLVVEKTLPQKCF